MLDANAGLLNARGGNGESAAMLAVYYGKKSVLELLLGRGAELNIFEAAAAGKVERVVALLAAEPSLANGYAPDGFPLLGLAAFFGHLEVVNPLLRHGADVNAVSRNATGYTALTGAVAGGHAEIAAALLAAGANANHRYGPDYTPCTKPRPAARRRLSRCFSPTVPTQTRTPTMARRRSRWPRRRATPTSPRYSASRAAPTNWERAKSRFLPA